MVATNQESPVKRYRADIIFIAAAILLSLLVLLIITVTKKDGAVAVVEIDGTVSGEYPLYIDGEFSLNGGTNILVIENGTAYLSYSECPDHTCERIGKIRYVGETIVCLPNRLTITITGDADNGVDIVS